MSEFPDWVEERFGFSDPTYAEAQRIHKDLEVVYKWVPDINERMRVLPDPSWPWWKRYFWYAVNR